MDMYLDGNCISIIEGLENMMYLEELKVSGQQPEDTTIQLSFSEASLLNLQVSNEIVLEIGRLYWRFNDNSLVHQRGCH